jgi:hypothetical protein
MFEVGVRIATDLDLDLAKPKPKPKLQTQTQTQTQTQAQAQAQTSRSTAHPSRTHPVSKNRPPYNSTTPATGRNAEPKPIAAYT